jgi:hypothetical protein
MPQIKLMFVEDTYMKSDEKIPVSVSGLLLYNKIKKNPIKCKVLIEEKLVLGLNIPQTLCAGYQGFKFQVYSAFRKGLQVHESEHLMSCKIYTHNKSTFL